jgi:hypothetical protein
MTDTDLIARAAQALRTAHAGQREGSGFTRARILATAQKRKRRRLRWWMAAPFGALLLAGSAWAQSSGQWPRLWHALAVVFVPSATLSSRAPARHPVNEVPSTNEVPSSAARSPDPEPAASETLPPEPRKDAPPAVAAVVPELPPASDPEPPSHAPHAARRTSAPPKDKIAVAANASAARAKETVPRAAEPEFAAFRHAYDLHFSGVDPRAAIQAFADYLAAYPEGRFVPEARYNTALDWLKLGDKARARQLLEPFARGDYDGYRRDEAARLLEAVH